MPFDKRNSSTGTCAGSCDDKGWTSATNIVPTIGRTLRRVGAVGLVGVSMLELG